MDRLSSNELALWHAWKRASELVRSRIVEVITAETGLSDPDFAVLTRVVEDGGGSMRQNQLADSMGYHRSRLSHHLSRMEERGLIVRRQVGVGMEVIVTKEGKAAVARARPLHAAAVRQFLIDPLADDRDAFLLSLNKLTETVSSTHGSPGSGLQRDRKD